MKLKLVCTCYACPEQYDVYDEAGKQVAYFRLRHGTFRADVPDCGGQTIYTAETKGDGRFADDERVYILNAACMMVAEHRGEKLDVRPVPAYEMEDASGWDAEAKSGFDSGG